MKFVKKVLAGIISCVLIMSMYCNVLAASSGSKNVPNHGTFRSTIDGGKSNGEKFFNGGCSIDNKARLRITVVGHYYKSGNSFGQETSGWKNNVYSAYTCDFECHHVSNKENGGKKDGMLNTKITVYGTADAITDKGYAIYTNKTF